MKSLSTKVFEFIQTNTQELAKLNQENLDSNLFEDILRIGFKYDKIKSIVVPILKNCITFDNLVIIPKMAVDFNIQDLITNIKTFIYHNINELKGNEMREVILMNTLSDQALFEVIFIRFLNQ